MSPGSALGEHREQILAEWERKWLRAFRVHGRGPPERRVAAAVARNILLAELQLLRPDQSRTLPLLPSPEASKGEFRTWVRQTAQVLRSQVG